jgi:hypothetical protein
VARYHFTATRKDNGDELLSGTIDDVLNAGLESMKMTVLAGLLHSHPVAKELGFERIALKMTQVER